MNSLTTRQPFVLTGAYVGLQDLLVLRHRPVNQQSRLNAKVVGNRAGLKLSKLKGRGVDFAEVRAYQPGDDIRSIDWRVTARKNKPHTKVFREERERPTLIVLDQTQHMFFGSQLRLKSVAAAEVAARIAWQNLNVGERVGGIVIGNQQQVLRKPFRTVKAVARLLNDIATFNQTLQRNNRSDPGPSLQQGLLSVRRLTHANYRIFLVSDFGGQLSTWQEHLHQLARHNQVIAVHVSDPLERELPPADQYAVTDGQSRLQFHSGDRKLRERYQHRFDAHREALARLCLHDNMQFIPVSTHDTGLDHLVWT